MKSVCKCKDIICTAPITTCEYWEGTFCAYDIQQEQEEQKLNDKYASVAQLVERRPEEPSVTGSIPVGGTTSKT